MSRKDEILSLVRTRGPVKSSEVVKALKVSRQTAAAHLRKLVAAGKLSKKGSTRAAVYFLGEGRPKTARETLDLVKSLRGLEEDRVFSEVTARLQLKRRLNPQIFGIASYAFTEMLNNAIDHSRSVKTKISVTLTDRHFLFSIRDFGIGIFQNIRSGFKLGSELEAYEWLLKGKQTTFPERHSGQGIFFTSKIADTFSLRSHKMKVLFDNEKEDIFLSDQPFLKGTLVNFSIRKSSRKRLENLFREFSEEEFEFDKNVVQVKASTHEGLYSRSQARRLTAGLQGYKKIVFNFKGVKEMGQAFADEIFRVFRRQNPSIALEYINASSSAQYLIRRAQESS